MIADWSISLRHHIHFKNLVLEVGAQNFRYQNVEMVKPHPDHRIYIFPYFMGLIHILGYFHTATGTKFQTPVAGSSRHQIQLKFRWGTQCTFLKTLSGKLKLMKLMISLDSQFFHWTWVQLAVDLFAAMIGAISIGSVLDSWREISWIWNRLGVSELFPLNY